MSLCWLSGTYRHCYLLATTQVSARRILASNITDCSPSSPHASNSPKLFLVYLVTPVRRAEHAKNLRFFLLKFVFTTSDSSYSIKREESCNLSAISVPCTMPPSNLLNLQKLPANMRSRECGHSRGSSGPSQGPLKIFKLPLPCPPDDQTIGPEALASQ